MLALTISEKEIKSSISMYAIKNETASDNNRSNKWKKRTANVKKKTLTTDESKY